MSYCSDHHYEIFANQEMKWHPFDSEERYQFNLKNDYRRLEQFGWLDNHDFTYKFNSHGFRCNEFTDQDSIMFLGCSHTVGVGLPLEKTFSQIVSKKLNLQCANLAVPATSNDTAFRLSFNWIPKLKPKIVVLMSPDPARFELLLKNGKFNFMPIPEPQEKYKGFYYDWIMHNDNSGLNQEKNKLATENIANHYGCKFIFLDALSTIKYIDYGRDLWHCGVENNKVIADILLEKIN